VYPPLPSGLRHHPVGQTCSASGDRTFNRAKDKLPSAPLKVVSSNLALLPKMSPSNSARLLKVALLNQAPPVKVALGK
jgi:hypothetical protein